MKRALISVWDKTGVVEFARELSAMGFEVVSTGGTARALREAGVSVTEVSEVTGFPECLDGRVKTLHPGVQAGLLARRGDEAHMRQLAELEILPIDVLACNLYPFKATILKEGVTFAEAVENIDIGGPTMLRAAAKNHADVAAIVDPADYARVTGELKAGGVTPETKRTLAAKVFAHTAHYDCLIADYLQASAGLPGGFPEVMTLTFEKAQDMRYGENPHQGAAYYREIVRPAGALANAEQLHGKELSFNNINDTEGALALLKEFQEPTVVACKHATPCGAGSGADIFQAWAKAYQTDPVSIFGGIVVANREIDRRTAEEIHGIFIEILLAPSFSEEAMAVLTQKKGIRLLRLPELMEKPAAAALDMKKVSGGLLVQNVNDKLLIDTIQSCRVATKKAPAESELKDLLFAWKVVKHVKSNAIAIAKDQSTVGIGGGQVNRIWACEQAIEHGVESLGADSLRGASLASDAYFPFPDCVEEAAKAGVTAIIAPGGSKNDDASIEACDRLGLAMIFTDMRHFRH